MQQPTRVLGKSIRTFGSTTENQHAVAPEQSALIAETGDKASGKEGNHVHEKAVTIKTNDSPSEIGIPLVKAPDIILSDADILDGVPSAHTTTPSRSVMIKSDDLKENNGRVVEIGNLACPICDEAMVSLLQLNRHIDDTHTTTLEPSPSPSPATIAKLSSPNEELRSWLRKTGVGSKLQTALPKSLAKLDLFDSSGISESSRDSSSTSLSQQLQQQPEFVPTKKHWRKPQPGESCAFKGCPKKLNAKHGIINCRRCGKLYCHTHSSFRLKLDQNANYDSRGVWCRACETCFISKPGYSDLCARRDQTPEFVRLRQTKVNQKQLYENKLHKRVVNFSKAFNAVDRETKGDLFASVRALQRKKEVEKHIVHWEDDAGVLICFLCSGEFGLVVRKHHCRLCGRVCCSKEDTNCSREIKFSDFVKFVPETGSSKDEFKLRICKDCETIFTTRRTFEEDLKAPLTPLLEKFNQQQKIKTAILFLLPKFQSVLLNLQHHGTTSPLDNGLIREAARQRTRLVESFSQFERLTKEMLSLTPKLKDELRLQDSIRQESVTFVQQNMAPLKQLPRILKQIEQQEKDEKQKQGLRPKLTQADIKEIKSKREELMVLNEQRFMVSEMLEGARKGRRFDEVGALEANLSDLDKMIAQVQAKLGDEGF